MNLQDLEIIAFSFYVLIAQHHNLVGIRVVHFTEVNERGQTPFALCMYTYKFGHMTSHTEDRLETVYFNSGVNFSTRLAHITAVGKNTTDTV